MNLKNKIVPMPDGKRYFILEGTPCADDPKKSVYLFNSSLEAGEKPNYSLWNVEFLNDEEKNIKIWPYDGADSDDLLKQLLELYLETAFDNS